MFGFVLKQIRAHLQSALQVEWEMQMFFDVLKKYVGNPDGTKYAISKCLRRSFASFDTQISLKKIPDSGLDQTVRTSEKRLYLWLKGYHHETTSNHG